MSINVATKTGINNGKRDIPTYVAATPVPYTRPSDWLTLPTVGPTEQKFVGLFGVFDFTQNNVSVSATTSAGTFTVDWGDGTSPQTYTSGTAAQYNYDYNSISNSTISTRGYKQVIITITPTSANLTGLTLNNKPTAIPATPTMPWLDMALGSPNLTTFNVQQFNVYMSMLEQIKVISCSTTLVHNYSNLTALKNIEIPYQAHTSNAAPTFTGCVNLQNAPVMNLSQHYDFNAMFSNCRNLVYIPEITFKNMGKSAPSAQASLGNMFNNCASLRTIPPLGFTSAYVNNLNMNATSMFSGCASLQYGPYFDTTNITNMSTMFYQCRELISVPLYNTGNCLSMNQMFNGCTALETIPLFNTSKVTNMGQMFNQCGSLLSIPTLNTSNVTTMSGMFNSCTSLYTIPLIDTGNVVLNGLVQFAINSGIVTVPTFNTSKINTAAQMFANCPYLVSVPALDFSNVTDMTNTFASCASLTGVSVANTSKVTTMILTFNGCFSLLSNGITTLNTSNVSNMASMFQGCSSLTTLPVYDTSKVTAIGTLFAGVGTITSIPAWNFANVTSGSLSAGAGSIGKVSLYNERISINIASQKLGKTELETMFSNAGIAANATQAFTITSNPGADTALSKTATWTNTSNVMTMANTVGVTVGCQVTGANIGNAIAVTINANNKISTTNPIDNNTMVAFANVQTSNLTANTLYWVSNQANSAGTYYFDIATSNGGTPLTFTSGTGNLNINRLVTAVNTNANITLSAFPSGNGTAATATTRLLNTNIATFKGWIVTG